MIKAKVIEEFTLNDFDKLKSIERKGSSVEGRLFVGEMDQVLTQKQMQEGVFITIANHHTCIVKGELQDIWDCRKKSVGNYYVRGE